MLGKQINYMVRTEINHELLHSNYKTIFGDRKETKKHTR